MSAAPGGMMLDRLRGRLRFADACVTLTPIECALLDVLMAHAPDLVRRHELLAAAWPDGAIVRANTLDSYIGRLRRGLRDIVAPLELETVRGLGYRLRG